ncbi:general secretion pathway protein L [Bradyrhizobium lablabi]|uniref:General secretion pathway protein L n=1 Tax=Bradyrhizobium lablabi TaxID=722472 RepID=A0A1M6KCK5_9BRAD|nr:PilN domain-containing protein [Bradyrhizobium lablabi]SHJ56668.1 general secretion pathway protein L [Bradyrhizobium lablabi]
MISELKELFAEWIAAVARAIHWIAGRFMQQRQISLIEGDDNTFTAKTAPVNKGAALPDVSFRLLEGRPTPAFTADWEAAFGGASVELLLEPEHILFRSLDFPRRAVEFLDGMIRAQIDRLTPWTANEAVFGWSPPSDIANERIQLTLAATSKSKIQPLLQLASNLGAASVSAFAEPPPGDGAPAKLKVFDTALQSAVGRRMDVPRLLRIILLGTGLAAAASLVLAAYAGNMLDAEQQQLLRQIAERRASLRLGQTAAGGSALSLLAKRKQTTPSSVMVLEAISRVLPDSTYVTELRIEGDKVQVVGISQDAPSLIRLMEQSPQFSRATFFAPTTRAQNDPGERFHIEVHLTPYFGSGT